MVVICEFVESGSDFWFLCHIELVLYGNFSFDDGGLCEALLAKADEHLVGLLVGAVVTHAAYPAWRIEVDVDGSVWETGLDSVARLFSLNAVLAGVATGKGLYTIAIDLVALHNLLRIVDRHVGGV